MKELFLENQKKDINSSINSCSNSISSTNELDDIYEMLMFTRVKSCYKESLIKILAKIVRHQPLIIIFSFIIGIIFFATPFIFIYIQLFENYTIPLFIICGFGFLISLLFIIIPCIDSKKYKYTLSTKIERKNIIKNIGNILFYLTLIVSIVFMYFFYENFLNDKEKNIKFDYESDRYIYDSKNLPADFIFKFIICSLLVDFDKTLVIKNKKIKMIYDDININKLRYDFINICIPLIVVVFFSLLKVFLIEVRQTIEKTIVFGALLILLVFQCFINSNELEDLKDKKLTVSSFFQVSLIAIILIGYILWNINYTLLFLKKRKDKNFGIRRYKRCFIITTIIIDIITCAGYTVATLSLFYCFTAFYDKKENGAEFRHLYTSFSELKYGFIPIIFGNSYYFGYYFLAMIFRPISSEFVPYELKNNHYVKAKRRLWNFMNSKSLKAKRRKFSAKLKQSMN